MHFRHRSFLPLQCKLDSWNIYMCTLNFKLWLILYFETFHLRYKILEKSIFSGQTNIELSMNFILYCETYLPLWILYHWVFPKAELTMFIKHVCCVMGPPLYLARNIYSTKGTSRAEDVTRRWQQKMQE